MAPGKFAMGDFTRGLLHLDHRARVGGIFQLFKRR